MSIVSILITAIYAFVAVVLFTAACRRAWADTSWKTCKREIWIGLAFSLFWGIVTPCMAICVGVAALRGKLARRRKS